MTGSLTIEPTIEFVKDMVPLRYPVLLVDRVLEWQQGERIIAIKAFTANEPMFGTHSPDLNAPVEALMIESMVQVAGLTLPKRAGKWVFLRGLDKVEILRQVQDGDRVVTEAIKMWDRGSMFRVRAVSRVEGVDVISGEITYVYLDSAAEDDDAI